MSISSEALKHGFVPDDTIETMSGEELHEFRNQFDPDAQGFDGVEGVEDDVTDK